MKYEWTAAYFPIEQREHLQKCLNQLNDQNKYRININLEGLSHNKHFTLYSNGEVNYFITESSDRVVSCQQFLAAIENYLIIGKHDPNLDYFYTGKFKPLNNFCQKFYPELLTGINVQVQRLFRAARKSTGKRQQKFYAKANKLIRREYEMRPTKVN